MPKQGSKAKSNKRGEGEFDFLKSHLRKLFLQDEGLKLNTFLFYMINVSVSLVVYKIFLQVLSELLSVFLQYSLTIFYLSVARCVALLVQNIVAFFIIGNCYT